jgi:hypothetical protein
VLDEGYSLDDINVDGTFTNLKGYVDTGVKNGYRITKIGSNLTVTVTVMATAASEDTTKGYQVTFNTDEHVKVTVYRTQDLTEKGEETNTAYSRKDVTGALTKDGEGQVNFVVTCDEGYEVNIDSIAVTDNCKQVKEVTAGSAYRITKITGEVTVTITSKQTTAEETTPVEEDLTNSYKVTFVVDEHTHVTVYRTQNLTDGEESSVAYARDGESGELLSDGNGQVNFVITCDEGYEVTKDSISVTGKCKQVKEVTAGSVYRITKIEGELTVTITSSPVSA